MKKRGFFSRLFGAMTLIKQEDSQELAAKDLTENPLTVELIERIAKNYDYHFEIVRADGVVIRFTKKMEQVEAGNGGVW